jgi:hypothetical protein
MKKHLLLLAVATLICLTACSSKNEIASTPSPEESTSSGGIEVDENFLTVDIVLPASLFKDKDMSNFNSETYAQEQGFNKAVLNEDGSVTVTMTKAKHKELLKELSSQYDVTFSEMIESENSPYIKNVAHTDNFEIITVDVDKTGYEAIYFELTPFTLGLAGMMYQVFAGDELHVEVIIKDADTGDILNTVTYPDVLQQEDAAS